MRSIVKEGKKGCISREAHEGQTAVVSSGHAFCDCLVYHLSLVHLLCLFHDLSDHMQRAIPGTLLLHLHFWVCLATHTSYRLCPVSSAAHEAASRVTGLLLAARRAAARSSSTAQTVQCVPGPPARLPGPTRPLSRQSRLTLHALFGFSALQCLQCSCLSSLSAANPPTHSTYPPTLLRSQPACQPARLPDCRPAHIIVQYHLTGSLTLRGLRTKQHDKRHCSVA